MEENEVRQPKNSLELLRWVVFEPIKINGLFLSFGEVNQRIISVLKICGISFLVSLLLYFLAILIISYFNIPSYFPYLFRDNLMTSWSGSFLINAKFVFEISVFRFVRVSIIAIIIACLSDYKVAFLLVVGLGFGFGFIEGVFKDTYGIMIIVLIYGFLLGLVGGMGRGRGVGFIIILLSMFIVIGMTIWTNSYGVHAGILFSFAIIALVVIFIFLIIIVALIRDWNENYSFFYEVTDVFWGIWIGLSLCMAFIIIGLWKFGVIVFIGWHFFYFRMYLYIYYLIVSFFKKYSLYKNPYHWDGAIFFPIFPLDAVLQKESFDNPSSGDRFVDFLKHNDRYNGRLQLLIVLSCIAGGWKENRCASRMLKQFPVPDLAALSVNGIVIGIIHIPFSLLGKFSIMPTKDYVVQIETTRRVLLDVEQESNARLRVQYFKIFREELDKLYDLSLQQPRSWGQYFVKALELWQKTADTKLRDLELEAAAEEPIVANIYRAGEKLRPIDKELFLGRDELRDNFKKRVVTATSMPLFFIQGQRRVGKSSLIAFLPTILDRGFRVVAYDMQEHPGIPLPALLLKIRERIHETLRIPSEAPQQPEPEYTDWLEAWHSFRTDLEGIAGQEDAKIVLAIDEYEELHKILKTNPEAGERLLAAMRSWSQSQNKVVFLFAGAEFFTDLREPNWGEFFVQAERLYVDYLGRKDAFKLIQLAGLHYPPELLERMFQDTQGHPCWLQIICRDIVTMVNKTGRTSREVTEADYEAALNRILTDRDDQVMRNFWHQFCQNWGLKDTVRQVLRGETPADERALLMLEDHHFIVPEGAGWRMRAPIFEGWLRRYQAT